MSDLKRTSNEAPLKDVIDRWLKANKLDGKMKEMQIIEAWPELMGVAVANRTKSLKFRNRVLHITMDSSVMRDELAHGKTIILERVNQFAGTKMIDDIWFA